MPKILGGHPVPRGARSVNWGPLRACRYYDFLVVGMVAVLLCANLIGPAKVGTLSLPLIGLVSFGAGNLFFPISYIFGDVLTEVYGYARARRAIWAGFAALLFATFVSWVILRMPPAATEYNAILQPALETVFGTTGRVVLASIVAYWVGDFVNSFVLAKMKLWTRGRWLWTRTLGSTFLGQGVDSLIFYPLAFHGMWTHDTLLAVMVFNFLFKVGVEAVFTPVTYLVVGRLKRAEGIDAYDRGTHFTPFSLRDEGEAQPTARTR
ncbi:MAG: queuosine precursor transporter [Nevskiales bacterium]|nr:queuosine precursor transporter [Nevskiales bacterium]